MRVLAQLPEISHLPGFFEPLSAISHLFGAILFLFLGAFLLRRGWGDRTREILLGVYAFSCVLLFSLSGVYHMMPRGGTARAVMERLDHSAIFILIAGTCTPAHGLLVRSPARWRLLAVLWTTTIICIAIKMVYFRELPEWLGLGLYLALGWVAFIPVARVLSRCGYTFVRPLFLGGIIYSVGAAFEYLHWVVVIPGILQPHEIFHLAVLVAALCHYFFVWQFAAGENPVLGQGDRPHTKARKPVLEFNQATRRRVDQP